MTYFIRRTTALVAALLPVATLHAQSPRLAIEPREPMPGALVRITLSNVHASPVSGTMSGEPLHFADAGNGEWHAIAAIPVDASGIVSARAILHGTAAASAGTLLASVTVPKPEPPPARKLDVSSSFTRPMSAELTRRIARENARARQVGRDAHDAPALWTAPFIEPRRSVITGEFGSGRNFNGVMKSRHLGVDFRGAVGDTVYASNRGVVALVAPFFLAGNVVYLSHGAGVVTGYFHLSKQLVAPGDTVERGQPVGLVGQTGRVTGPHLHWNARYGAVTFNPLDLTRLAEGWYGGMEPALRPGQRE